MGFRLSPELERKCLELAGKSSTAAAPTLLEGISEKEFQDAVIGFAKRTGWRVYHTHDSRKSERGFPDLVMVRERVLFVELKTDTGEETADQLNWLESLQQAGANVQVWRPNQWAEIERTLQ